MDSVSLHSQTTYVFVCLNTLQQTSDMWYFVLIIYDISYSFCYIICLMPNSVCKFKDLKSQSWTLPQRKIANMRTKPLFPSDKTSTDHNTRNDLQSHSSRPRDDIRNQTQGRRQNRTLLIVIRDVTLGKLRQPFSEEG